MILNSDVTRSSSFVAVPLFSFCLSQTLTSCLSAFSSVSGWMMPVIDIMSLYVHLGFLWLFFSSDYLN